MKISRPETFKIALVAILMYSASMLIVSAEDGKSNFEVDISPGVCPNIVNISSQGLMQAAILGTADFDVRSINASKILLGMNGSSGKVEPFRWHYDDVAASYSGDQNKICGCHNASADGYGDLILEFDIYRLAKDLNLQKFKEKNVVLTLTETLQGISGKDCVQVMP